MMLSTRKQCTETAREPRHKFDDSVLDRAECLLCTDLHIDSNSLALSLPMAHFRQFEHQVREHKHQIYGFACSLLKDEVTAQDVTQDVFVKLWENRDEIEYERALPWLMRVTRNACIDQLRRQQTRNQTMTVDTESLSRAKSGQPLPDTHAEASDFQDHLNEALDRIDEPYRSVVTLRELQDLKYQEIAEVLDMPLNTVKVYIHRGRKKLKDRLSEQLDRVPA